MEDNIKYLFKNKLLKSNVTLNFLQKFLTFVYFIFIKLLKIRETFISLLQAVLTSF